MYLALVPLKALKLLIGEPLDQALAERLIGVRDEDGEACKGVVKYDAGLWSFMPDHAWLSVKYSISISPGLEDLAGNTINYLFDVEKSKGMQIKPSNKKDYQRTFRPIR